MTADLLYGARAKDDYDTSLHALVREQGSAIELHDVEICYSLFELPMQASAARLPASLHPSVPAVLGTSFWRVASSPFGPFQFGYVALACRTGIKPRHFVIGSWFDNPAAGDHFRKYYGFQYQQGLVNCRESYAWIEAVIADEATSLLRISITDLVPIIGGGATVKYSAPLNACVLEGQVVLAQFEASYAFKRVLRGRVSADDYDAAALGDPALYPREPIAGTYAICDVKLLPLRFLVDTQIPAEQGGARKITDV